MTVEEGAEFFKAVPSIRDKLETLARVGLGYIHIGQQATTLSGGEAQRIKLAKELSRRATGRTLYILDEPTTGLHFHDVAKLLEVLHELADAGNTVVVIEHNLEVIKTADWIIDMGPEGGDGGGRIVAEGTPEEVAKVKDELHGGVPARPAGAARRGEGEEGGGGVGGPTLKRQLGQCFHCRISHEPVAVLRGSSQCPHSGPITKIPKCFRRLSLQKRFPPRQNSNQDRRCAFVPQRHCYIDTYTQEIQILLFRNEIDDYILQFGASLNVIHYVAQHRVEAM